MLLTRSFKGLVPAPTTRPVMTRSTQRFGGLLGLFPSGSLPGDFEAATLGVPGVSTERSRKMPTHAQIAMANAAAIGPHEHGSVGL
jgi:hypothetical protein